MAAVRARGTTIIDNAAREPEIADLAAFLVRMGARITGGGSSTIEVEGVDELTPVDHTVIPDRIEAGTFLAAVGVAGGEITLDGARADHMDMLMRKLGDMGMRVSPTSGGVWAQAKGRLRSVDVSTLPYPGIATDYKPFFVALLAAARAGDRGALARLISLVEEGGDMARQVGRLTFPLAGRAYAVGITGPTGSGKSTLTERLITKAREEGSELAVLAVDPSSPFS